MVRERGFFRPRFAFGLLVLAAVIGGVALIAHFAWPPVANGAENRQTRDLPVRQSAAGPAQDFTTLAKGAMPAVVNVSSTRVVQAPETPAGPSIDPFFREFFGEEFFRRFQQPRERRQSALGSGVIVSRDGYIVTNYHVIAQADEVRVLLSDQREYTAKVVGSDPPTDVAVLKIDAQDLPTLPWGDSEELQVGEYVLALGNPFGLDSTVTMGIVSAVGRANVGIADYEDFIQTDAAINPGNSGGALLNTRGELVGINTAIFSGSGGFIGVGFAVPSNMARPVMDSLIKTGKVVRGWLGVSVQPIDQELAQQFGLEETQGALIAQIMPGSPADEAGFQTGDVIVSYAQEPVVGPAELRNAVAQTGIGQDVQIAVIRNGERRTLNAAIVEQPPEIARAGAEERVQPEEPGGKTALAGLQVRNLTPEIAQQLGLEPGTRGVVVTGISPESPAAAAGLLPGDVILEVNREPVRSVSDLKKIVAGLSADEAALLLVNRGGAQLFQVIRPA